MEHLGGHPPAQPAVGDNDWSQLRVPELGAWTPTLRVSAIVPAKDPGALDLLLRCLAAQTYPSELLECIVVDDGSEPPLDIRPDLPATRTIRTAGTDFGAGRCRNLGAHAASGDILLFLDADVLPSRRAIEAHARWHHIVEDALVAGPLRMADLAAVPTMTLDLMDRSVDEVLDGVPWEPAGWTTKLLRMSEQLTTARDDTWSIVVGANVSLRRTSFERIGGFTEFGLRGIEDSEFGYRAFIDGAIIIPDPAAHAWHPSERHFSDPRRAEASKRRRLPLVLHHVPVAPIRTGPRAIAAVVPRIVFHLDGTGTPFEATVATVESILREHGDVVIVLHTDEEHEDAPMLRDAFIAETRVIDRAAALAGDHAPFDLSRAPTHLLLRGPVEFPPGAIAEMTRPLLRHRTGVVRIAGRDDLVGVTTRAWNRSTRVNGTEPSLPSWDEDVLAAVARDFGEKRIPAGVLTTVESDTVHGGLADAQARNADLERRLADTRAKLDRLRNRRIVRIADRLGGVVKRRR